MNIPEGWKLVPVEPTQAMVEAAFDALPNSPLEGRIRTHYRAMLAAAPTTPVQQCRDDGRCQYAIDHDAEGMGHCPPGKCVMPAQQDDDEALEVLRLALYALMESVDLVQHDYNTDWRHGIPTRAGQLKASLYALNAHKDAIERIRALLTKRGAA